MTERRGALANKQVLIGALVDDSTREQFVDMVWRLKTTQSALLRKILKNYLLEAREGKHCD